MYGHLPPRMGQKCGTPVQWPDKRWWINNDWNMEYRAQTHCGRSGTTKLGLGGSLDNLPNSQP